jgi:type II secretory pathway predicted ATPase ExeA
MYEAFYQLKEKPFSLLPDPDFLYLGGKYQAALSLLEYGVLNQAGFIVLTGEPGMGKTTLLRKLVELMKADFSVGLVTNTHRDFGSLLPWILAGFGLPSDQRDALRMFQELGDFLKHHMLRQRRVLLIVDEAQNLTPGMLEELRLLSNLNAQKVHTLQVLLCGQPDLRTLLKRPDLIQFAQRVSVDYHLIPLREAETEEYIRHRLRIAGGAATLFTHEACLAAHRLTGGLPRLINQVCDMALTYGFAEQAPRVVARLVIEAVRDREAGGIMPVIAVEHLPVEDVRGEAIPPGPSGQPPPSSAGPIEPEESAQRDNPPVTGPVKSLSLDHLVAGPQSDMVPAPPVAAPSSDGHDGSLTSLQGTGGRRSDGGADHDDRRDAVGKAPAISAEKSPDALAGLPDGQSRQPVGEGQGQAPAAVDHPDSNEYGTLYKEGVRLKKAGWYKDAIRTFERAASSPAFWHKSYAQIGLCFREAGRPNDAISAFRKALTNPGVAPASLLRVRYEMGKTLQALGKQAEAVEQYRIIARVDAGYLDVSARLGKLGGGAQEVPRGAAEGSSERSWLGRTLDRMWGTIRRPA